MSGAGVQNLLMLWLVALPFCIILQTAESKSASTPCGISVYWGRNRNEGSLREACQDPTPLYQYVSIAFLNTFGNGQNPGLDLTGHCSPAGGGCRSLASEIKFCQQRGVKVLLSLGGPTGDYSLSSEEEASQLAENIHFNYLSGGEGGPLGDVELDGVDFYIESPGSERNWDALANAINNFYKRNGEKFYLSATAGCNYPDRNLNAAIQTGVFNSVSIRFYDDTRCDMSSGVEGILRAWSRWTDGVPEGTKLFMGLPAQSSASITGFVDESKLLNQILPNIKATPKYGGIMLWNRYYDKQSRFSSTVLAPVCRGVQGLTRNPAFISQVV